MTEHRNFIRQSGGTSVSKILVFQVPTSRIMQEIANKTKTTLRNYSGLDH